MISSRILPALLLLSLVTPVQAAIYKYIDKNGNLVLTDEPVPGATKIEEKPVMTIPAMDKSKVHGLPAGKAEAAASKEYVITIVSPKNDATIQRHADEQIPVGVSVSPALERGHVLDVLLDGRVFNGSALPSELDRGSHTLSTRVRDAAGKVLKEGPSVTFHIQQPSLLSPARQAPPTPKPKKP